jgi:hypothetical protein
MSTDEKLKSALERLTGIEKFLMELVHEDAVKHALLILAASRCRAAKAAISEHLAPDPPPRQSQEKWWNR